MSAPPTSIPIGWSPSEIVRAVLPTRPSSASGLQVAARVRYVTRTTLWAMPGDGRRAEQDGIGSVRETTEEQYARRERSAEQQRRHGRRWSGGEQRADDRADAVCGQTSPRIVSS